MERTDWLLVIALVPFVLGLAFYVFAIARFDLRQLTAGHGDHWITGGALAISTLAAGKLLAGAKALAILGGGGGVLKDVALVLWVLTMLWLPVLVVAEITIAACATTSAGGRPCSPSACTPRAAS